MAQSNALVGSFVGEGMGSGGVTPANRCDGKTAARLLGPELPLELESRTRRGIRLGGVMLLENGDAILLAPAEAAGQLYRSPKEQVYSNREVGGVEEGPTAALY